MTFQRWLFGSAVALATVFANILVATIIIVGAGTIIVTGVVLARVRDLEYTMVKFEKNLNGLTDRLDEIAPRSEPD